MVERRCVQQESIRGKRATFVLRQAQMAEAARLEARLASGLDTMITEDEFEQNQGEQIGLHEPEPEEQKEEKPNYPKPRRLPGDHTISPEQRALMSSAAEEPDLNVQSLARQIADSIPTELALKTVLRTMGIDMWIKAANPLINLQHPLIMEDCR